MKKGYLEVEASKNLGTVSSKNKHMEAQNYIVEDKNYKYVKQFSFVYLKSYLSAVNTSWLRRVFYSLYFIKSTF